MGGDGAIALQTGMGSNGTKVGVSRTKIAAAVVLHRMVVAVLLRRIKKETRGVKRLFCSPR